MNEIQRKTVSISLVNEKVHFPSTIETKRYVAKFCQSSNFVNNVGNNQPYTYL